MKIAKKLKTWILPIKKKKFLSFKGRKWLAIAHKLVINSAMQKDDQLKKNDILSGTSPKNQAEIKNRFSIFFIFFHFLSKKRVGKKTAIFRPFNIKIHKKKYFVFPNLFFRET